MPLHLLFQRQGDIPGSHSKIIFLFSQSESIYTSAADIQGDYGNYHGQIVSAKLIFADVFVPRMKTPFKTQSSEKREGSPDLLRAAFSFL